MLIWLPLAITVGLGLIALAQWLRQRRGRLRLAGSLPGQPAAGRFEPVDGSLQTVRLADVAGMRRVKAEVWDVVALLRDPERFRSMGIRTPKGVLLEGPPGTGKTLLARAIAGEAGAHFFQAAASEFIEMYVGIGAARVRQLFEAARRQRPSIIFIDEIDAIGARAQGPHQEDVRTITQLLKEMDGFAPLDGVVVLAATNRADSLDPALLRPGRFDRIVSVDLPTVEERREILALHARNKPFAPEVDPLSWAEVTVGFAGANLENLLNEAALGALRQGRTAIAGDDLTEAYQRTVAGIRTERVLADDELRVVAYHEAGHALCAWFAPAGERLQYVSILPRGRSLGQTVPLPKERGIYTETDCRARLTMLFGGRAAELVAFGAPSSGAAADLRAATDIARHMAADWGMAGRRAAADGPWGRAGELEEDVERLLAEAEASAVSLLSDHREKLDALAAALAERETLEADALRELLGEPAPVPLRASGGSRTEPRPAALEPAGRVPEPVAGAPGKPPRAWRREPGEGRGEQRPGVSAP